MTILKTPSRKEIAYVSKGEVEQLRLLCQEIANKLQALNYEIDRDMAKAVPKADELRQAIHNASNALKKAEEKQA